MRVHRSAPFLEFRRREVEPDLSAPDFHVCFNYQELFRSGPS
jgi:hypothetical protein